MSIKELPEEEKPRERLERLGVESLSNVELLAIIIGYGVKNFSAMDVAYNLIKEKGLISLSHNNYKDFMKINGVSKAKSMRLASMFELYKRMNSIEAERSSEWCDSKMIYYKYKDKVYGNNQEYLGLITVDKQKRIKSEKIVYIGTKNYIKTSVNDILRELVVKGEKYFYLFHNHPDDGSEPSDYDVIFTNQIISETKRYGFSLVDHIIITRNGYYSFKEDSFINC